jgi:predicted dehydrogenase
VCDQNEKLAAQTASEFGVPNSYANLSQLLTKESIDIVDLCVPPQVHAPLAIEALEHGCHVIMEKPMALRSADCREIIRRSEIAGKIVCIVHNDLFHPPMIRAREAVAMKEVGDVVGMRILLSTPREEMLDLESHWYHRLPGGMLGETGPHLAYMTAAFINGVRHATVVAKSIAGLPWAPFDDFRIELEGQNGNCSATVMYARNNRAAVIEIFGTEALLRVDLERMSLIRDDLRTLNYSEIGRSSLRIVGETILQVGANAAAVALHRSRIGTDLIIEKFVESVRHGTAPPVTSKEGLEAVRIMELIVEELRRKYPDAYDVIPKKAVGESGALDP